ncbi:MAG: RNA methyltransferase [Betaproteobacteria bacterium]|nr:RNA methyltransferase [Betaproteobacteria bacterium]
MDDSRANPLDRVRVVLVAPSHPGNVGASARAMLAMGLSRLALVAPSRFPDHEATRRATGATAVLDAARVVDSLDAALEGVSCSVGYTSRPREFAGVVVSARDAAALAIASARAGRESALVFGTEMSGLSNDDLARCTAVATIPTNPAFASLNLAAAVQVAAYEARVASQGDAAWQAPRFAPATHDEIERLHEHAERTFVAMRFLHPEMPRRLMPRLRRLFARAGLEKEEVSILRGILARVDQLIERRR